MRPICTALLLFLLAELAEAAVCSADLRFINRGSSEVVIELLRVESYEGKVPAPPSDVFVELSPESKEGKLYRSYRMKATIPAGTDQKRLIQVGCGARVWINWRTVEADPIRTISGQTALINGEGTISVQ